MTTFVKWFEIYKGKYIDIEIAGEVFGGRHGESPQLVRDYEILDQMYKIYFRTSEILTITSPSSYNKKQYGTYC